MMVCMMTKFLAVDYDGVLLEARLTSMPFSHPRNGKLNFFYFFFPPHLFLATEQDFVKFSGKKRAQKNVITLKKIGQLNVVTSTVPAFDSWKMLAALCGL